MQIIESIQLDFKDVLIEPQRSYLSSRSAVTLIKEYSFGENKPTWKGVPIIAANMDTVGTFTMAKTLAKHQCMTALSKHYTIEELSDFFGPAKNKEEKKLLKNNQHHLQHSFYSMGIVEKDLIKFEQVLANVGYWKKDVKDEDNSGIKFVCIDVANGYMQSFVDFCRKFSQKHPQIILMAGNVVTKNIVEELGFCGVDIVKAGIGPGSVCTTRKVAGVGRPQLSTIIETASAAHGLGNKVCGDGGCTVPADVSKAFAAGADFVMLGGMLSGHEESEIEPIIGENGKKYLKFYGMSSEEAMSKHSSGVAKYKASEGKVVQIEFKGSVNNTILDILGGVRSTCTYVGAKSLKELPKRTTFYRVSMQTNDVFGNSR